MRPGRQMKHGDLFLVRFWTEEAGGRRASAAADQECHGKVQRVVNGESREFEDWETLVETLRAMLSPPGPLPDAAGASSSTQVEPPASPAQTEKDDDQE